MRPPHFEAINDLLDDYYPDPQVPLDHSDPYTLLVAVVLSAQCTDLRVNKITPDLWAHGRHPADISALSLEQITEIIKPCGLYVRKAKAIRELSAQLVQRHGGEVPREREALQALPGVGRKTANVILSHVFDTPAFAVDTHVIRLANRWQWSKATTAARVEQDLCAIYPESQWDKRHLQMIYFGRNICKAKGHKAEECPACSLFV